MQVRRHIVFLPDFNDRRVFHFSCQHPVSWWLQEAKQNFFINCYPCGLLEVQCTFWLIEIEAFGLYFFFFLGNNDTMIVKIIYVCQNWEKPGKDFFFFFSFLLLKAKLQLSRVSRKLKAKWENSRTSSILLLTGILNNKGLLATFELRKNTWNFLTDATFLTDAIKYLKYICTKTV